MTDARVITGDLLNHQHYYKLDANSQPVACDAKEWADWFVTSHEQRVVARTVVGSQVVQTTFTSLWMGQDTEGNPILWETIVMGVGPDGYREANPTQWTSLASAHAGHLRMVQWLEGALAAAPAPGPGSGVSDSESELS